MAPDLDLRQISGERLRAIFDSTEPLTIGLEEEVMLLDPETLDLLPCAPQALERLGGDPRFKAELPAAQLEIITPPCSTPSQALAALAGGRRDLARGLEGLARPAVCGVHPFAEPLGELSRGGRYDLTREEFGAIARRQLVASLQVHIAVGGADRTLAVYNALRPLLPCIAALAANAAFYEGRDSGMASVRPKIAELLPRQGLPPPIASWEELAAELRWGAAAGVVPEPRLWWWELRPHPGFGTLEMRVPDAQTTLSDAAAVAAAVHSLVAWLAQIHDAGEVLPSFPTWRIAENRWSAARNGVEGEMADLQSGRPLATRDLLGRLFDQIEPAAAELEAAPLLGLARELAVQNGAIRQREIAAERGVEGLVAWMAEGFLAEDGFPPATQG
jgi:carboxylate-amine ligase